MLLRTPTLGAMEDLRELQRNWDEFGRRDPMWAVLTEFGLDGGQWDEAAFFASGVAEISTLVATSQALGIELHRDGRALDFGCGVGRLTQALADVFAEAVGVDIAPSMLEAAKRLNHKGDRVSFVLNDRPDLALFDDASFDCIYSKIVLQHIPPEATRRYLAEFVRILRPGGVATFQLPSHHVGRAPLPAGAWRARTSVPEPPVRVKPGEEVRFAVVTVNTGDTTWEPGNDHGIAVGAQWRHDDGRFVQDGSEGRVHVRNVVPPGGEVSGTLTLTAPPVPGSYRLYVDVLQEEVAWFHDRGNHAWIGTVQVGRPELRSVARRVIDAAGPVGRAVERLRRRVPVLAPPPPAARATGPVMEMNGLRREEVEAAVASAGGTVIAVHDDPSAPGWVGYTYWVGR
jgi:SAM-dependent methyltransferase